MWRENLPDQASYKRMDISWCGLKVSYWKSLKIKSPFNFLEWRVVSCGWIFFILQGKAKGTFQDTQTEDSNISSIIPFCLFVSGKTFLRNFWSFERKMGKQLIENFFFPSLTTSRFKIITKLKGQKIVLVQSLKGNLIKFSVKMNSPS